MTIKAILEADKKKLAVFGRKNVMRELKLNKLNAVYLSENCEPGVKAAVEELAKLNGVEVTVLKHRNDELGTLCKKLFSVSVIGTKLKED